ncbi:hypothetical protein FLONG3_9612 [Fusarium longipes]|uniref:Uncharacterized protein n=1 Tax=Fusarium longipes TaxID=694270 RepID=A0A395RWZ3_9HYPO|nr:hypothetical protein FLONG3_9612 [Fusarium longipes]
MCPQGLDAVPMVDIRYLNPTVLGTRLVFGFGIPVKAGRHGRSESYIVICAPSPPPRPQTLTSTLDSSSPSSSPSFSAVAVTPPMDNLVVPRASLLGLPRELRLQIYRDYFTVPGGYVYDGDTDKLVQANSDPIQLSLRRVCRTVAHETHDFPFSLNSVKFSTVYRKDWQKTAACLKTIVMYYSKLQRAVLLHLRLQITPDMFNHDSDAEFGKHMPTVEAEVAEQISLDARYPGSYRFASLERQDRQDYLCRPSSNSHLMDKAITHVLRALAAKCPHEFEAAVDEAQPGWSASHSALDFFNLTMLPWEIPSLAEAKTLAEEWNLTEDTDLKTAWYRKQLFYTAYRGPIFKYRHRHYLSAASLAIRFLTQITARQRLSIRRLVVNEDRTSGPRPECHPLGLIPFSRENPNLYIDHRINIWRNFVVRSENISLNNMVTGAEGIWSHLTQEEIDEDQLSLSHQAYGSGLKDCFSHLMSHTMEILNQGINPGSYTLTLDGEPDLNCSTYMFTSLMKPEIAYLTLHTDVVTSGLFVPPDHPDYPFMARRALDDTIHVKKGSSLLRCNFTLDQPWNYEKMVEKENRPISPSAYIDSDDRFDIRTPFIHLQDLQLEYFDRKKLMDSTDDTMREYGGQRTFEFEVGPDDEGPILPSLFIRTPPAPRVNQVTESR